MVYSEIKKVFFLLCASTVVSAQTYIVKIQQNCNIQKYLQSHSFELTKPLTSTLFLVETNEKNISEIQEDSCTLLIEKNKVQHIQKR